MSKLVAIDNAKTFKCGNCSNTKTIKTESLCKKDKKHGVGWTCDKCKSINKIPSRHIKDQKIVECKEVTGKGSAGSKKKKATTKDEKLNVVRVKAIENKK